MTRSRTARLLGLVTALSAAGVLAQPPVALADHTPAPESVALVGSLQSELGCPADWQPECAATELTEVAGSPGVYRASFDVPAGSYEYKVALDDGWDENYGADGAPGGANIVLVAPGGPVTFTYDHRSHVISDDVARAVGGGSAAHWLTRRLLALAPVDGAPEQTHRLFTARDGGLTVEDGQVVGGEALALTVAEAGLPAAQRERFPHLADWTALRLPGGERVARLLRGQLAVATYDADGTLLDLTGVQTPGVIDSVQGRKAVHRRLGLSWRGTTPELALWAPTARSVSVHVFADGSGGEPVAVEPMTRTRGGVWTATGTRSWKGQFYLYEVEVYVPETDAVERNLVTDPYSLGLSTNSERSLFIDLRSRGLRPDGWSDLAKPVLGSPEEQSLYELHVRDFSISDETVPERLRGTYQAFAVPGSNGMQHLRDLAQAGLTTVHLLPVNDIATIEERRSAQQTPDCDLASYAPDSEQQQECVSAVAGQDGFNWGYDPLHYTAPEGSYATDPDGPTRTRQFRNMVAAINGAGLRVVIDVVYNHTSDAGQAGRNDLDRIVPGYYHRRDPLTGAVETSTCCSNTATEHRMMAKLMIDSVLTWTRAYKVDGFRFDLMGHQPKAAMVELRERLDALTLERDGVDGRSVYLYGEGWNFGEVQDDARFVQATQANMAGTGIGTFNDRLRDAVRGGGPFDEDPRVQGFASGLLTDPNGADVNGDADAQRARLLLSQDQIKVGLAGNLADYAFVDRTGETVTGKDVDYNGSPTGYAADPQETINYVEAHDNETLFDALAYKLPQSTPMEDRVRLQVLGLSTVALAQGVSFWHAGGEILRSKSLDRNSYDSGDWFNVLDFSYRTNGFGRGLPPRADNESKYAFMRPLLADPALRPGTDDILSAKARAQELLQVRRSSPLFALETAELVQQKVRFPSGGADQTPGVIVLHLDDTVGPDVDPDRKGLVVLFNASDTATEQQVPGAADAGFRLHAVQAGGSDPVVQEASYDAATGTFAVPARTVAVFEH